jgi:hypothetical protein
MLGSTLKTRLPRTPAHRQLFLDSYNEEYARVTPQSLAGVFMQPRKWLSCLSCRSCITEHVISKSAVQR